LSYLKKQRDIYKFLHDQTLHLVNQGYTPLEIAEMIKLPDSLSKEFYNRGYYGTVSHNVKAIYQRYIGWFDGNPAHLHELPPVESSRKYVEFMGGASQVLKKARESFAAGDYRWVAQVVNHVVFADPSNTEARQLQADALEQLGYQAESAPWRNFYLVGASELRNGVPGGGAPSSSSDFVRDMPTGLLFDYFAIRLNADRASGKHFEINWNFTDIKEQYAMTLENSVLNYLENKQFPNANLTLNLTRSGLTSLLLGEKTTAQLIASGDLRMQGNPLILAEFLSLLDKFEFWFNIVTP
jgi:alkyl sulfatase BDS1-like metallo-beta-lactamase superfamily hydrolase